MTRHVTTLSYITGEWKNDMINGQGDMLNVNGDHYIGELLNYQYHGYGLVVRKGFLDRLLNKEAVTAGLATEEEKERKWEEVRDIVSEQVLQSETFTYYLLWT